MAIELEKRGRTAWLTLSRPDAMNAFDDQQIGTLAERAAEVAADEGVRAVVITGAGDAFSVGLDLALLGEGFEDPQVFRGALDRFGAALAAVEAIPVPTIAAVNGLARAGGFELLLACDLVIVADDARIGDTHLASGLPPGGGATARLPRRVGRQHARELLLTGRWLDGIEAVEIGLALSSVARGDLHEAASALAEQFATLSRSALATTKAILRDAEDLSLADALGLERDRFEAFIRDEPSASEGYRAFREHREPRWD